MVILYWNWMSNWKAAPPIRVFRPEAILIQPPTTVLEGSMVAKWTSTQLLELGPGESMMKAVENGCTLWTSTRMRKRHINQMNSTTTGSRLSAMKPGLG